MGFEKEGSKSGAGYVGGFFHLFDWTGKSREKIFSSNSDVAKHTKQGKKSGRRNLPTTRLCPRDEYENEIEVGVGSSIKGNIDYNSVSSVMDEKGYGTRPPSVVARLMGLDSLPSSSSQEPYSTGRFDTQSLGDVHYNRQNFDYYHDHQIVFSGNMLTKVDSQILRNFIELKSQKIRNKPIEKFQTEILPPKSAKSIPITNHKLLSPIKSHGYIPSKNVNDLMEALAKIIEPGPQATAKARLPLVGSASVPLKVQALREKVEAGKKVPLVGSSSATSKVCDLKEKLVSSRKTSRLPDVSRRQVESNAAQYLKGHPLNKSWNGPHDTPFKAYPDKEESASAFRNKGKSVSLAVQAKVNVQRREGMNINRNEMVERDQSEVKSSLLFRNQQSIQKNLHKKPSMQNGSGILRLNSQKQNSLVDKNKFPSKPSVSISQGRKLPSANSSVGRQKSSGRSSGNCKFGTRQSSSETTDGEKEYPYSCSKNISTRKRSIDGSFQVNKNLTEDHILNHKSQKSVKSNPNMESHYSWAEESPKKGIDVVSFTFTAPFIRSMPDFETSGHVAQIRSGHDVNHHSKRLLLDSNSMKLSSLGYSDLGGDALSFLFEEKLRELTNGLQTSSLDSAKSGSASNTLWPFEHKVFAFDADTSSSELIDQEIQHVLAKDEFGDQCESQSSSNNPVFRPRQKFQEVDEIEDCGSSTQLEARKLHFGRYPSPISILEPSFLNESCDSSVSTDSNCTEGSKLCSSILAQEVHDCSSAKKLHSLEADTELSDSASSTSFGTLARNHARVVTGFRNSTAWELGYVKEILRNVELMFKAFAWGRTQNVINPRFFDFMESKKGGLDSNGNVFRLTRKVLFDCVSECLDLRCKRYVGGGYREWVKGVANLRRKEWLEEEVYKEISGWRRTADSMVDELVEKDMSSRYGRWTDFEEDTYVLGIEVEDDLFNSLIDEVVADIFPFDPCHLPM